MGGHVEYVVTPARNLIYLPKGLVFDEAPRSHCWASHRVPLPRGFGTFKEGETVLVRAAAGGSEPSQSRWRSSSERAR